MFTFNSFIKSIYIIIKLEYFYIHSKGRLIRMFEKVKGMITSLTEEVIGNIERIVLTDHAENRWNERVGPYARKSQLNRMLTNLHNLGRIRYYEDFGVVDNEIVFHFSIEHKRNKVAIVQTFLGRISLKPLLEDVKNIRNRYVYLFVEPEILQEQRIPQLSTAENQQLVEIHEQISFDSMTPVEQLTLSNERYNFMKRELEEGLKRNKRQKQRAEREKVRKAQKEIWKDKRIRLQEKILEIKMKKMEQQIHMKCSAYSSLAKRNLSAQAQEEIAKSFEGIKVS